MNVLFAADGSACAAKALAFVVGHPSLVGPDDMLLVLNVQPSMPNRVAHAVGADVIKDHHREEADKVLEPVKRLLDGHALRYRCEWLVGVAADEIVAAAAREKSEMVVMGTRGHGFVGSLLLGSVAQRVLAGVDVPVLLIK